MRTLLLLLSIFIATQSFGQSYTLDTRLTAYDKEPAENYGTDVHIHENLMIIGAPNDGVSTSVVGGSAYIYELIDESWTFVAKLRSNDSIINVDFGHSVAISNEYAVVGDPLESDQGAAYVFEKDGSSWTQINKLEDAFPNTFDRYGTAVEIDGDWIFVGNHKEGENASETDNVIWAGAVFVYNFFDDAWQFDHKMVPEDRLEPEAGNQQFGYSLAADNGQLIVGAPWRFSETASNVGAVYFFENVSGTWEENTMLRPADGGNSDNFGWDVDLKGNTAVAGSINHNYDLTGDNFSAVAGAAYYLTNGGTEWLAGGKLVWSDRASGDYFGSSVAITPNEEKIIVGMYEDNTILEFDGEVYNKSECGAAVVFGRNSDSTYSELQRIVPSILATQDNFGNAMSASNTSLVIGAYRDDIETYPNEGLCNLDSIADNGAADVFKLDIIDAIHAFDSNDEFLIYPNPATEYIDIVSVVGLTNIRIINLNGQVVKTFLNSKQSRIDISDLETGMYFIQADQSITKRFIKE